MSEISKILQKETLLHNDLVQLLSTKGEDMNTLFLHAQKVKEQFVGNKVYFRGLIELSNRCKKNCYYCGIRSGNPNIHRYFVDEQEVLNAVQYAHEKGFGSIVLQSGERNDKDFAETIERLLKKIMQLTNNEIGITLSLGEQDEETYARWRAAGAKRYLLRIEASNRDLYAKLHPQDHNYDHRLNCLQLLRKTDYQVGTGVMIGLPFQTLDDLAEDLLFFKTLDIDMCGMGPYIEHEETPLYQYRDQLLPKEERFLLSLKMVALLRILMKNVNIAATTAMQTLDPQGREKALRVGSNVIMPNLTPLKYRDDYLLYEDKPAQSETADETVQLLEEHIKAAGCQVAYFEHGDSQHYQLRK
ncbi:MAG: [FeFe] hydrogenase H-cluster radical SAM maturase HydE [Bacteroidales bacterium]|nr:[FeFe] hydrogenase H-cluster radical SAM maturase HydE [Bacteroidales bacterium]